MDHDHIYPLQKGPKISPKVLQLYSKFSEATPWIYEEQTEMSPFKVWKK